MRKTLTKKLISKMPEGTSVAFYFINSRQDWTINKEAFSHS